MSRDLSRLLRPRSIAVIGGGWGQAVIEQCQKMGFSGEIWPVHPTRDEICGRKCCRLIEDLPAAPDAAFIGVNRTLTVEAVGRLAARGAGGAVCFASGFAEAEDDREAGAALQARLVAAAGDMPVIGPNCYGLINYLDGALLWPDQHGGRRVDRGVAILGQSSNVLINLTMQRRGLPLAYVMAAGNQAQIGLSAMALSVIEDPRITAVGLHIEGIDDLAAFQAMASRARALGKPVVALKVGRSAAAQAATVSHTASLAGGDAAGRAALSRLGVAVVDGLPAFLETLKFLHVHGPVPGRAIASMSCSGGEASLIGDAAEHHDVHFRPLSESDCSRIRAVLGDRVTIANPLDYHTFIWGDVERMAAAFAAMMRSGFDLTLLVYDFPRLDRCDDGAWECGVTALRTAVARTGARAALLASLPENLPEARAEALIADGIAPMAGFAETLGAVAAAAGIAEAWARPAPPPMVGTGPVRADRLLDEAEAKAVLARAGVPVPEGRRAATPDEAATVAATLGGPLALKALGVAHKTEAGAVALGLTPEAVAARARGMSAEAGFLVERMVCDGVAELIVGVVRDPVFGLSLTIGAGGVLAELLADRAMLPLPATEKEIGHAIAGLRIAAVLSGWRGRPPADHQAVVRAIRAIGNFAVAGADRLVELDVNPLIVTPTGAFAADALIHLGRPGGGKPR